MADTPLTVVPERGGDPPPPLTFSVWVAGILRRRRLVIAIVAATVALSLVAGFVLPPSYRAHASFAANSSSNRLSPGMGGGAALQGLSSQLGLGPLADPSESPNFYAKLIESNELRRRLATSRFADPRSTNRADSANLIQLLGIRHPDSLRRTEIAVKKLSSIVRVGFDTKTNIVGVRADSRWPELSADLANRTVDLVVAFNREQRVSRARSKRVFLETRLATAYDDLRAAEERQRQFYEQNRLWRNAPGLVFEEGQLRRDADLASDLYLSLRQQFESARLDEFNDAALITVVDQAVLPRKPVWPSWGLLTVSSLVLGTILAVSVAGSAVIMEDWRNRNPRAARFFRDSLPAVRRRRGRPEAVGTRTP